MLVQHAERHESVRPCHMTAAAYKLHAGNPVPPATDAIARGMYVGHDKLVRRSYN